MKGLILLASLFLAPGILYPQTNVDKTIDDLVEAAYANYDNWKFNTDESLDPLEISKPGFDDSSWKNLKLDERIYIDWCWLRKEITVPEYICGVPVKDKIDFKITVDDYGTLYINGSEKGKFWWTGEFVLSENAKPGAKFVIAVKAINTGGPLRIISAQLDFADEFPLRGIVDDVVISLLSGQRLLSPETYQTSARLSTDPGIDKSDIAKEKRAELNELLQSTALEINVDALKNGRGDVFELSVKDVLKKLEPVSGFAKQFTLRFASNAHIDAAWLWRKKETVEVCERTFSSVIKLFKAHPDFTYTQSQAALYEWMEESYPILFNDIKEYVDKGRWELVGGMWVEPDCNLISGESWSRQLLYGQNYFSEKYGKRVRIGWNPDSFGYNVNMPMFFKNAGIDIFVTQKISWNDTQVFPYRLFRWQSPDGSSVLTFFPFNYVNEVTNPAGLVDWLRQFEANTGLKNLLILYGVGDHGGGPSLEMMQRIDLLKDVSIFPTVEYGSVESYLEWIEGLELSDLPVWDDELYLQYHRGTYTTQAKIKEYNRQLEALMTDTEKLSSIASLYGYKYRKEDIEEAWKTVLFNQFHDILPGSHIREVAVDAWEDYEKAETIGDYISREAITEIAEMTDTESLEEEPVTVFNSLSWERTSPAVINLPEGDENEYILLDTEGDEVACQEITTDKFNRELLFIAEDVPPLGYKTYQLKKGTPSAGSNSAEFNDSILENEFFYITFDESKGNIASIVDKKNGKAILSGYGNKLQILEDKPAEWDAWNIGLTGKEFPYTFRKIELVEQGPVRTIVRAYFDYLKPGVTRTFPTEDFPTSFFTQDVILYNGIDYIDFKTRVEWWEEKTMLKVAFPLKIKSNFASYDAPYGIVMRSTSEKEQKYSGEWEVPALRWADISDSNYGVSVINNSKYGYDVKGNTVRLSLLRSPVWPDPIADKGAHEISYALYPHNKGVTEGGTIERGYEYNNPLRTVVTSKSGGELPLRRSFIGIEPINVKLTSIKLAEDGSGAWIVQFYESAGKDSDVKLRLPVAPESVYISNFLEDEKERIEFTDKTIEMEIGAGGVRTIKIKFE